jgi:50S ribosomal protein L16 3-hydroxylase
VRFAVPGAAFPVTMEDIRRALGEVAQKKGNGARSRLFVNGRPSKNVPTYLPGPKDTDGAAYVRRLEALGRHTRFGLVVNNLQGADFGLWAKTAQWLSGLYAHTGVPPFVAEVALFLGNYERTGFGIHKDDISVVLASVQGAKQMFLWRPDQLTGEDLRRTGAAATALKRRATGLWAKPGDLVYWPAGHWHVGESRGLSATLNIGFCFNGGGTFANPRNTGTPGEVLGSAVDFVVSRAAGKKAGPLRLRSPGPRSGAEQLPAELSAPLALLLSHPPRELGVFTAAWWLKKVTGAGFKQVPPPRPGLPLRPTALLHRGNGGPVKWTVVHGRLVVAANGHVLDVPHPERLELALRVLGRWLASGRTFTKEALRRELRWPTGGAAAPALGELLDTLYRWRAVDLG